MAIAYDSTSGGDVKNGYSHTCGGENRALFVGVLSDSTVSGCTYGGTAMTLVNSVINSPSGNNEYLFYLTNPSSGANTVQASGGSSILGKSTSFTGVRQSGQPEQNTTNTGTTSVTCSVTTTTDNCWLVGFARNGAGNLSAGTNTTARGSADSYMMFDTNAAQTPAGSKSMQVTAAGNNTAFLIASIAPFALSPLPAFFQIL